MKVLRRTGQVRGPAGLRGRVVVGVLALLVVLLLALFATVDLLLTARLHADLRTRLTDRVALAEQLDGALSPQQLVDRLRGDGVTATLCSAESGSARSGSSDSRSSDSRSSDSRSRCVTADTNPSPPGKGAGPQPSGAPTPASKPAPAAAAPASVETAGPVLFVRTVLPSSGQVLTLSVDSSQVGSTIRGLILLEVIGGAIALVLAALLLGRVVGTALRPLDDMTVLARNIAAGDRGRRLGTDRPDTELGRTAVAFDDMLDELESAIAAAAAAEQRLRSFLSDVSHELRTPLTGLAATTETLLVDEPDRLERERAYVTLVRETRRAGRLVDDLLTVARLDTGMTLAIEDVDLAVVAAQEVERLRLTSPAVRVELDSPPQVPVDGDAIRLGQIVGNLLSNARAAAGPDGRIDIAVTGGATWDLQVLDDGPGVPEADRERIFERLVRLDGSRTRGSTSPGGFGLGLSIARMLARAHGGDLRCTEPPGDRGARFVLSLPVPERRA